MATRGINMERVGLSTCLFLLLFSYHALGATDTDISRLRRDLLNNYDKNSRPIENHRNTTVVHLNFLMKGFELDERLSTFTMHAWTVMVWKDTHLKWDPTAYGNLTKIHFAAHELWQPDFAVYNNFDKSEIDHFGNTRIVVFSSSQAVWVPPTKLQVGCTTNLRKWPYDQQLCQVVIGSWAHDGSQLDMVLPANVSRIDLSDITPNREWEVTGTSFKKRVRYYSSVPDVPFPDVLLSIGLQRKSNSHTACIVVPGLVIAAAVLIAFWLPPGSIERTSILLMTILINVLYLYYIYSMIPNNGDSVPLVVLFYRDSLVMLSFALIWTVCLRYLAATRRTSPVPLPGFIQSFLESIPAKILCLDPRPSTGERPDGTDSGPDNEQSDGAGNGNPFGTGVDKKNPFQEDWAWLAHLMDRVVFMIYLIVYLCFYLALL